MQYFVGLISLSSGEADVRWSEKLNSRLIASCVKNTLVENHWKLLILL